MRCFALLCVLLGTPVAFADTLIGKVVGVADGDTVTVLDAQQVQHRVRLMGIDAPEKTQPFGGRAKQNLSAIVFGRQVEIDWNKRDRYGRIIGRIRAPSPECRGADCPPVQDVCIAQVATGFAWHFKHYESEQFPEDRARYAAAEEGARAKRLGLWADPHPVPPWNWRREKTR